MSASLKCARCGDELEIVCDGAPSEEEKNRYLALFNWSKLEGMLFCQICNDKGDSPDVPPEAA